MPSAGLDSGTVVRMIQRNADAIRACHERELREQPTLQGARLTESTIPGPAGDATAACVVSIVSAFHFVPGPVGGSATFVFPFVPWCPDAAASRPR